MDEKSLRIEPSTQVSQRSDVVMKDLFKHASQRRQINRAFTQGVFDAKTRDRVLSLLLPVPGPWWLGSDKLLRTVGTTHVLVGIAFFFAFNWVEMTRLEKFGVLEGGLALCFGFALYKGTEDSTGKYWVLVAVILMGILMGVVSREYHIEIGYALVLIWLLSSLPLVAHVRFRILWGVWMGAASVGIVLLLQQEYPSFGENKDDVLLVLALFYSSVLVFGEVFSQWNLPRLTIWAGLLMSAAIPLYFWVNSLAAPTDTQLRAAVLWALAAGTGYVYFREVRPNFHALALAVLSFASLAIHLMVRLLMTLDHDWRFFAAGVVIILFLSGTVVFLNRLRPNLGGQP